MNHIRDVLKRNGTAVDAAIASLICNGVYSSQSMGIGGGFLMTIFSKETGKVETLNARETAPGAATKNMYHGDEKTSEKGALQFYSCYHDSRLCIICGTIKFLSRFIEKFISFRSIINSHSRRNIRIF